MKNIIISTAFALSTLAVNAHSNDVPKNVNTRAAELFCMDFPGATGVSWSEAANKMARATCTSNGEQLNAFYTEDGEFLATTKKLSAKDLPAKLKTNIQKSYGGATIIEALDFRSVDEHAFFLKLLENGKEKVIKGYWGGYVQEANLLL